MQNIESRIGQSNCRFGGREKTLNGRLYVLVYGQIKGGKELPTWIPAEYLTESELQEHRLIYNITQYS